MYRLVPLAVALLVGLAGCAGPAAQSSPPPTTEPTPTEVPVEPTAGAVETPATTPVSTAGTGPTSTPTATPVSLASAGALCDEDLWTALWRPQNDKGGWTQRSVRVSYTLPANTSIFLVAYVGGELAGVSFDADYGSGGYHVDGFEVDLRREFTGSHLVQVVVYTDRNGNEVFDPATDRPCLANGTVVQAGPTRLNFSRYGPRDG